jgi:NADPH:quinone reductase-like Zn-dependent oxidoreductase
MLENGSLKPVIDRSYDLSEASDAFRTFGEGHVRGKLILTI